MNQKTPLYETHSQHNAKIVPFAGYDMPIQYADGVITEHEWVRSNAGIFDVSHMGQVWVKGEKSAEFFTKITPSSFLKTPNGKAKYTVLTNENGGIIDDLIITRVSENEFFVVINAACKDKDIAWMRENLLDGVQLDVLDDRALIAVQGQKAENVLSEIIEGTNLTEQSYMSFANAKFAGQEIFISRLGYTGEDGFEISIAGDKAAEFWNKLLENESVKEIGLGARDTLRLEMGYPLYGHDIDDTTSPIEADLAWVVAKTNEDFIGSDRILHEKSDGVNRKRVGVKLTGKGIAREGAEIYSVDGEKIGDLTSGGFSPSLKQAIGQGYVNIKYSQVGTKILVRVRGRDIEAVVEKMPFVEASTK
jgi:aminomethyltransferase